LHAALPLAGRLVRVLRTVVEVPMLTVLDTREPLALRRAIALELLRHEPPGDVLTAFEELAEELLGRLLVAPPLHEDVEHYAVLIHRPPQRVPFLVDRDEHFVQMPLVTRPGTPATALIRILLPELPAPLAHGFVRHEDPTDEQQLFHIAVAEREAEIEPDSVANNLSRKETIASPLNL
jgi:hypothetical protein